MNSRINELVHPMIAELLSDAFRLTPEPLVVTLQSHVRPDSTLREIWFFSRIGYNAPTVHFKTDVTGDRWIVDPQPWYMATVWPSKEQALAFGHRQNWNIIEPDNSLAAQADEQDVYAPGF